MTHKNSAGRACLGILAFSVGSSAHAQASGGFLDALANAGVEIRKSFTGSAKEAGLPASLTYENPDSGRNFHSIDLGIKTGAFFEDQLAHGSWAGRLFPTLELHRSTKEAERLKKAGGALTMEFERGVSSGSDPFSAMWFADAKFEMSRDSIEDQTSRTTTLRIGYYDVDFKHGPGKDIVFGDNQSLSLRWMLTGGVEDYRKLPIKAKVNGQSVVVADEVDSTVGFGRLNVLVKPFRNALNAKLALTATYTIRLNVSGDDFYGETTRLTEASLDWYLDAQNRFALGLSYQHGRDPARNFLDEEFSAIGLKLKLSK